MIKILAIFLVVFLIASFIFRRGKIKDIFKYLMAFFLALLAAKLIAYLSHDFVGLLSGAGVFFLVLRYS